MAINHGHLGMQKTGGVFMDVNALTEQRVIHGARRVVLHEVFVLALQQQGDLYTASRRAYQRTPQLAAGHKVGVGNQYLAARFANGFQIRLFNTAPVAQVVTQHERRMRAKPGALNHRR